MKKLLTQNSNSNFTKFIKNIFNSSSSSSNNQQQSKVRVNPFLSSNLNRLPQPINMIQTHNQSLRLVQVKICKYQFPHLQGTSLTKTMRRYTMNQLKHSTLLFLISIQAAFQQKMALKGKSKSISFNAILLDIKVKSKTCSLNKMDNQSQLLKNY